ncbi:hypothetical protein Sru01_09170 [Sphaerisporangium rufum]|uniref:Tetratricopeptide repeat protein n=1 Tax=Sphaerisporangium rufum TaxID=1381558 RepID=A0A919R2K5_9ACTN|nr:hypothetical protein Sru01_09170 [Sphaerisporangium rufum]
MLATKLDCSLTYLVNGVTADQMEELDFSLRYAALALENGEVAEARRRYAELLANDNIAGLVTLRQQAEYGYALATEACGELDEAIETLSRLRVADPPPTPERRVAIVLALCRCYRDRGQLFHAVEVAEDVLAGPERPVWTDGLVELGATLLGAYFVRGDLLRARQFSAELLAAAESLGSPRANVAACWNAAVVAQCTGHVEESLQLIDRALAVQSEYGEPRNLARLRIQAAALRLPHDPAEARDMLRRARRQLSETSASTVDFAWVTYYLAQAEYLLGNAATAAELAREATDALDDRTGAVRVETRLMLANALMAQGRGQEARKELALAEELLEKVPVRSATAAGGWMNVATAMERVDVEAGVAAYQRALACAGL